MLASFCNFLISVLGRKPPFLIQTNCADCSCISLRACRDKEVVAADIRSSEAKEALVSSNEEEGGKHCTCGWTACLSAVHNRLAVVFKGQTQVFVCHSLSPQASMQSIGLGACNGRSVMIPAFSCLMRVCTAAWGHMWGS